MQGDLFTNIGETLCASCGKAFTARTGRGRPQRYCGAKCRRRAKTQQNAAWAKRTQGPPACWTCGAALPPHQGPGRFSRFCGEPCRRVGIARRERARRSRFLTQ